MTKKLLPLIALLLAGQGLNAQSFDFEYIDAEAGRPFSEVTALMIDWRDYLWVGGADGRVCRFDGLVYTCWGEADGLPGGKVNDLIDGVNGQQWAATEKGIALWDGDTWTTPIAGRRAINHLAQLPFHMESKLIATRNLGLFIDFEGQLRALHPELIEQKITAVFHEGEKIVVASDEDVYQVGTNFKTYSLSGLPRSVVSGIAQYDENHLLLAIDRVGLVSLNERTGNLHILNADERLHKPVDLIADPVRSGFWLSTAGQGLIRLNDTAEVVERFRPPGRINDAGGPLLLDRWGQLWMGGDEQLVKAEPSQLKRLDATAGLPNEPVYAMARGQGGRLQYLAVGDQGIYQRKGGQWQRMNLAYSLDLSRITTITQGWNNGSYWLGDSEGRISIMKGDSLTMPIQLDHFSGPAEVSKIITDGDSSAWIGTTKGLARLQPDTSGHFSISYRLDLPEEEVSALLFEADSSLWIGQPNSNLVRIDTNGKATYYDRLDGLPSGTISSLAIDYFNRLWAMSLAGPYWSDLTRDTLHWRPIPRELFDPAVSYLQLLPTDEGLWLTTNRSLQLLRWNADGSWAKREVFGPEKGWTAANSTTEHVATTDGRRYFANATGLTEYRPDFSHYTPSQPNVVIEEVSLFYEPLSEDTLFAMNPLGHSAPRFQPNQNHFSFQFRAVDLQSPRGVSYRYRLTEVSDDWSPETQSTSISFAGLKPGFYTFCVQARVGEDRWGEWAACDFIILYPWWQRGFMPYLLGLLICTSAGGLLYAYVARIRKREEKRRSALELQNKLLSLEQQALQLQMNPHFIFNALGGIQSLIDSDRDLVKARAELQEFARLMRGILHNSRQKKISLIEEVAVLESYLRTASNLQTRPFDFDISLDPSINPEEVELPPMLIQPFVENAIIHGLAPLREKGQIKVAFTREGNLLLCRVSDNGIGREAAARLRKAQQPGHRSVATEVNRQRLELMRGNEKYAPLIIRDSKDESGMPKGTEVILKIKDAFIW